jgi:fibronectin type 3 domain-containing protein
VAVDVTPPATPAGLFAMADYGWVSLDWADNSEHDLAGYNIYRSTIPGSYGAPLTQVSDSTHYDLGLTGGTPYYYRVTATDTNGFESAPSSEVSATPKTVPPGMTLFGLNNDGLGGFTHTPADSTQIWSTNLMSVQYRNEDTDMRNASLLKAYTLDRSDGQSYTVEGVITLTDGYPEDNARVGLYLFGDVAQIPSDTEAGALYIQRNFEGADFTMTQGIHLGTIASAYHGRAKDYTWFTGEEIRISVDIAFTGADIDIEATLTDGRGDSTTVIASVPAADYTGDYFGFVTRSRTRDFGAEPPTIKSAPFTMDYRSFWVTETDDTAPAAPTGLAAAAGNSLVSLDWNDNAEGDLDTYTLYRSTTPGSYEDALVSGLSSSSYTDYLVDNDTTYYYTVTASDHHANESSQSADVFATPAASIDTTPPAAPTGLLATTGDGFVSLDWDNNAEGDLHSYRVYRSTTSGSYGSALISGLSSSVYTDPSAANGVTYFYTVTAVDTSANESPQSAEVFATPDEGTALSDVTVFGSSNNGTGGFTQSAPGTTNVTWSVQADSVRYRNQDGGTLNSSLLREFVLDRSNGSSYTIEGVVHLTDGYADDNNRVGIYLFADAAGAAPGAAEPGDIGVIFNIDDSVTAGAPGNNADDDISIRIGIDGVSLSGDVLRNQDPIPFSQDLFGTDITLSADITFTNVGGTDSIQMVATLTDWTGAQTMTPAVTVAAAEYPGDWFGFVTRARARNYLTDPTPTPAERSSPWVMDYRRFSVMDNSAPGLEGYALWASGWGVDIGASTNDFDSDGLSNLYEYGMDGNPTNGLVPTNRFTFTASGNGFIYVHPKRSDDTNILYRVETTTNLVSGSWMNDGYTVVGTNVTGGTLDFVTNNVHSVADETFIRLKIEQ